MESIRKNYSKINKDSSSHELIFNKLLKYGIKVDDYRVVNKGINSKTFCLEVNKEKLILKCYPDDISGKRERLLRELSFLNFLDLNKINTSPKVINFDQNDNWILLSWVEGINIKKITNSDANKLIYFLKNIQKYRNTDTAIEIMNASEAKFSLQNHFKGVEERFKRFNKIYHTIKQLNDSRLNSFLSIIDDAFKELDNIKEFAFKKFSENEWITEININERILSPSDIGFHNILKNKSTLNFIDFEYAGWDDPRKLVCDLILQPDHGIPLSYYSSILNFKNEFIKFKNNKFHEIFLLRLYRLKWLAIILNPFISSNIELLNKNKLNICNKKSFKYLNESYNRINKIHGDIPK